MSLYQSIPYLRHRIASDAATLVYLWMMDQPESAFTQADLMKGYGLSRRSTRHFLYILIDAGLIRRELAGKGRGAKPIYYIMKPKKFHLESPLNDDLKNKDICG